MYSCYFFVYLWLNSFILFFRLLVCDFVHKEYMFSKNKKKPMHTGARSFFLFFI